MFLCYVDESGTTGASTGDTTHFVLAGISIPIWHWRDADREVSQVLGRYGLADAELHTAWMLRKYLEQSRIPGFEQLGHADRRREVNRRRNNELSRLGGSANNVRRNRARKLHRNTDPYVHLTWDERRQAVLDVAEAVSNWGSLACSPSASTRHTSIRCGLQGQSTNRRSSRWCPVSRSTSKTCALTHPAPSATTGCSSTTTTKP